MEEYKNDAKNIYVNVKRMYMITNLSIKDCERMKCHTHTHRKYKSFYFNSTPPTMLITYA